LPLAYMEQSHTTWIDMGSPEGLYRACEARLTELGIDRWVDAGVDVSNIHVGSGTVISQGAWIGEGTTLKRCLVLPNARIEAGLTLENSVVGAGFTWVL